MNVREIASTNLILHLASAPHDIYNEANRRIARLSDTIGPCVKPTAKQAKMLTEWDHLTKVVRAFYARPGA